MGSGWGSVGRPITSDNRDPQFETSHRQILYWTFVYCQLHCKDENKEKDVGNSTFFKKVFKMLPKY